MSASKTQAFILKTQDYRDTSVLASFYTQDFGKIRGIVKGIRDPKSSCHSTLEAFSLNEIVFYKRRRGGDLHLVTHIDLLDLHTDLRNDLEKLSYASYFVDLVNELVEPEEPNPDIFNLLTSSLEFLSSGASPKRCARIFEIKLFEILGLMPEIKACVVCQAVDPSPVFFNVSQGGIHCKEHRPTSGSSSVPVSRGALNFLQHVMRSSVKDLYQVKVSQEVGEELEKILRRFVDFHLSYKLKSLIFMEKMEFV